MPACDAAFYVIQTNNRANSYLIEYGRFLQDAKEAKEHEGGNFSPPAPAPVLPPAVEGRDGKAITR